MTPAQPGDAAEEATARAAQAQEEAAEARARAHDAEEAAEEAAEAAATAADDISPDDPLLDTQVRRIAAEATPEEPFGRPGEAMNARSPFRVAFLASIGVLLALVLAKAVVSTRQVLVLIVVAVFLAIGLDPAVSWLMRRGLRRGFAVFVIALAALGLLGGFVAAVIPPISSQTASLIKEAPHALQDLQKNNATVRKLDSRYHLIDKLRAEAKQGPTLGVRALGGVVGAGKAILGALVSTLTVAILTVYFLANLPGIKRHAYRLLPKSRRARVGLLTDEVLDRVGGYVLGNLATSLVAGATTFVFLLIVHVPYPLALGMVVAITDLIPLVGATIGAVIVTVVALFQSVAVGAGTLAFYVAYQQFENYVLQPRVMKKAVDVAPVTTIVAALLGAALLGIVGALLAVPVAAAVQLVLAEVWYPRQDAA